MSTRITKAKIEDYFQQLNKHTEAEDWEKVTQVARDALKLVVDSRDRSLILTMKSHAIHNLETRLKFAKLEDEDMALKYRYNELESRLESCQKKMLELEELKVLKELGEARNEYKTIPIIGKEAWEKLIGNVDSPPPIPQDIESILEAKCPYFKGKRVKETHILVLIPKLVNGEPLTLLTWNKIFMESRVKTASSMRKVRFDDIAEECIGQMPVKESYWALITKECLPDSNYKTYEEQLALLKNPYLAPNSIELCIGFMLHYLLSGQRLLEDTNTIVYTRCIDSFTQVNTFYRIRVGSNGPTGPCVRYGQCEETVDFKKPQLGMMAVRRIN